jgi:hypothetical protein
MRITLKSVNHHLAELGVGARLEKGDGYCELRLRRSDVKTAYVFQAMGTHTGGSDHTSEWLLRSLAFSGPFS